MSISSLMWLFPIVFMLHDFEEIIMFKAWFARNGDRLRARFPTFANWLLPHVASISTPGFALAVAEELVIFTMLTWAAVSFGLHSMWAGLLLAFLAHLLGHFGQFLAWRGYVPVIATSGPAALYCGWALWSLHGAGLVDWAHAALWATGLAAALVVNGFYGHVFGARFSRWLDIWSQGNASSRP